MNYFVHTLGSLDVLILPALEDNYIYLLIQGDRAAAVDPADAAAVLRALKDRHCVLTDVLITHHHYDHVAGNEALKARTGCRITGPDDPRVPGLDCAVGEGDAVRIGSLELKVLATPGHSGSHISFYAPAHHALWCGDTLFAGGCGRVLEGQPNDLWQSLNRLAQLPDETLIFCGHEYTMDNLRFALTLEPANKNLQERLSTIERLRLAGKPSVPSTLAEEKRTNPFLRVDCPDIRRALNMGHAPDCQVFAAARRRKDVF